VTAAAAAVVKFLKEIGLGQVESKCRENAVDGQFLAELRHEDLMSGLGLTQLQPKKLLLRLL
jgi:hypothetical protein